MQQSHRHDCYYPLNHLDFFAGIGGALVADIYNCKMANGLISLWQTQLVNQPHADFFLSIEKKKTAILEGISSSLNIHKSDCHRKGGRVKKGKVGIIRLG
jgi:hypothetical protein